MPTPASAVGVFDSGLGGLTVARALMQTLPKEPIVYLGDTAHVPYGNKSKQTVLRYSTANTLFLLKHKVKLVVVACNTASSYALSFLKRNFQVPVLGVIEPGVQAALAETRSGRIGVIGTHATIASEAYTKGLHKQNTKLKVTAAACPLFVPLVEEGWADHNVAQTIAKIHLAPLKAAKVDTVILGCTHYPLLKDIIQQEMGSKVVLVDSAEVVAHQAQRVLLDLGLLKASPKPVHKFFVTDAPKSFETLSRRFLGRKAGQVQRAEV